jgi:hypothetical protein
MQRVGQRQTGIVLVTVLFLSILIAMFIGAAILVGPRTLGLAGSQDGDLTAAAAAESGMQYAIMRIRENPDWRGEGGGTVLNTPDFVVVEDAGYVWGHMTAPDGSTSMFRIRFNFENGAGDGDNMDDSSGPRIITPFVSLNNLSNSTDTTVPRASEDSASTVIDRTIGDYRVPAHGLCLIVEGIAGPGTREFNPGDPNPKGLIQTKLLEGTFVASNLDDLATDAAAMSNSDLNAVVEKNKAFEVQAKGGGTPRIRSRGGVTVKDVKGDPGKYDSKGIVYTKDKILNADYNSGDVTLETENAGDPFYELTWDDLKTADPAGDTLAAGTYVWWDDGTLHYYDMDYDDYASHIRTNPADAGNTVFSGGSWSGGALPSSLTVENGKFKITGDLYIEPTTTGTSDLTIIPREGAPEEPGPAAGGPTAAGPALASYLANNPSERQSFFNGLMGNATVGGTLNVGDRGWNTGGGSYADITWDADGSGVYVHSADYPPPNGLEDGLTDLFTNFPLFFSNNGTNLDDVAAKFGVLGPEGDLNLNTGDTTTADDLEVKFEPPDGESATLSSEGNIRIGAKLKGQGASITSAGTLKVIGAGTDLSSLANSEEGVNMYAKGDITLSTLKEKANGDYEFKDIKLKGLVYTWGDFRAKMGNDDDSVKRGKLEMEGTLVAFGGDPANGKPATTNKGLVDINAREVKLKFDPAYLLSVMKTLPDNVQFKRTAWTSY